MKLLRNRGGAYMYIFKVRTDKWEYKKYNNMLCTVVDAKRDDNLVEVFIPKKNVFLLLLPTELEDID